MNKRSALFFLAVLSLTAACGGAPDASPVLAVVPTKYCDTPTRTWNTGECLSAALEMGSESCLNTAEIGFQAPANATHCEVFNPNGQSLANVAIVGGKFYCSVPAGYVTCTDSTGKRMWPDKAVAMCPFDGAEPSCPEVDMSEGPFMVVDPNSPPKECPFQKLRMPAPDPT